MAQIIATAAFLAGHSVRGLDQTGLAQKGGAVVSDLFISSEPQTRAAKLSAGECDLYLAADLVVGADPENLHVTRHDRTVAVAATAEVPTGGMVAGEVAPLAGIEHLRQALDHATREAHFLDAHGLAQTYCGSDQYANIVLLGAAYQLSQIPIPESLIEQAIELNGQDVGANLQAFRRGRQAVVAGGPTAAEPGRPPLDPALATLLSSVTEPDTTLHRLLDVRANELAAYQNDRYARRYVDFVAEIVRMPDGEGPVAEAVARQLYRLMAYKDEYEVARLSLDNRLRSELAREFGPDARYRHLLQPPILNALGLRRKVSVGRWFHPVFHLLRQLRVLRASPLDPFGHTALRRRERMLIEDYRHVVRNALTRVPGDPAVLELAGLPEVIRGFDEIKLASIEVYQSRQAEILADLEGAPRSGGAADVNAGPTAPPSPISRA
jgi:indolepyruvate ferredoxin oxidoreductase